MTTRVVCYGLGPIGVRIAQLAATRSRLELVGAIDIDPHKVGRDLGEVLGRQPNGISISADAAQVLQSTRPDVVLHSTSSSLVTILPQLQLAIEAGAHVVSTCEELSYPWTVQPQTAAELDILARRAGVVVLGTGVNPGYAMDALPLMLTAPCATVRSVRVLRVVDAGLRRGPLQRKVGAGLSRTDFEERVAAGSVRHVGLPESLHMISTSLGWELEQTSDLIEPMIAENLITTEFVTVQPGQVAGVRQVATGWWQGREVVRLELQMYVGAPDPQDTIELDSDPPVRMTIAGGLHGDVATAAMAVNAIQSVQRAAPGLETMAHLPLVHCW